MKKIIAYFPKGSDEDMFSPVVQDYEKAHPEEFICGHTRSAGTTVHAQPRSELKKESWRDRIAYCKRKGIVDDEYPDDDRVLVRHNDHGFHYGKHRWDSME